MEKGGINIIGHIEEKIKKPSPLSFSNGYEFTLKYSEEDEVRMGLFASELKVFKGQKEITHKIIPDGHLASLPSQYQPFSKSGIYCAIPNCPVLKDNSLVIVNTIDLTVNCLKNGFLKQNQFSPDDEKLLVLTYSHIFIYGYKTGT